jgi:hypothetical protein
MASPTELARQAQEHSEALESEFKLLKQLVDTHDLPAIRDVVVRLEARLTAFEKFEAEVRRINVSTTGWRSWTNGRMMPTAYASVWCRSKPPWPS